MLNPTLGFKIALICIRNREYFPNGFNVYIAPKSLREYLERQEPQTEEARMLDKMIYHYIPDEWMEKGDWKTIAERELDKSFEFVNFIRMVNV